MGRDRLFPRKGLLRQKTPVYIHRQAVDPRTLPDGGGNYSGVNLHKVRMPGGSIKWSAVDDGNPNSTRVYPRRMQDRFLQGTPVGTTYYKGKSLRDKLFSRYSTKITDGPTDLPNKWAMSGRSDPRSRKLSRVAVVYRRPVERIPGTYIAAGGAVVAGGAAAEGHRRIAKAYTRKYSDTEFLPSNFNPQPAAGRGRRIPVPLDMAAAANVYATNLPRLLGAATGRGKKMSEKDATNSILELLFASRMQNRTM